MINNWEWSTTHYKILGNFKSQLNHYWNREYLAKTTQYFLSLPNYHWNNEDSIETFVIWLEWWKPTWTPPVASTDEMSRRGVWECGPEYERGETKNTTNLHCQDKWHNYSFPKSFIRLMSDEEPARHSWGGFLGLSVFIVRCIKKEREGMYSCIVESLMK